MSPMIRKAIAGMRKTKSLIFKGTKKQKKAKDARNRILVSMNTGTRTIRSKRDYNRAENKVL